MTKQESSKISRDDLWKLAALLLAQNVRPQPGQKRKTFRENAILLYEQIRKPEWWTMSAQQ